MLHPSPYEPDEDDHEQIVMGQGRPEVLFEAGMALGMQPERTLVVEIASHGRRPCWAAASSSASPPTAANT